MKRTFPPAGSVTLVLTIVLFAAVAGASRPGVSAAEDAPKGTVWVVNRDLGELAIFDAGTGDLLKKLAVGRGAHDICISEQTGKAYITAETDNMVTVVDTETLAGTRSRLARCRITSNPATTATPSTSAWRRTPRRWARLLYMRSSTPATTRSPT